MNDRLQALLAAERAAAADVDDAAFAARVVSTLRGVAVVGSAAVVTTSTSTPASASATTVATTKGIGGLGIAKLVGIIGAVAAVCVGSVVVVQGQGDEPRSAPVVVVQPVDVVDDAVVDDAVVDDAVVDDAVVDDAVVEIEVPAVAPQRRARVPVVAEPEPVVAPLSTSPAELARYDEASAALRAGRVDEAAMLFAAVLAEHPRGVLRPEAQVSLVESLYRAGRFEQVVLAARAAVVDVDVDGARRADVRRLEAEALVKLGRCDESRPAWAEALAGHARQLSADDVEAAVAACATH